MEGDFQSCESINTKMKKRNKKKNSCVITMLWPNLEALKKSLFIDLEKQEITRLSTGNKLSIYLHKTGREQDKLYYSLSFWSIKRSYCIAVHRLFFYWHYGYLPKLVDHKDTNSQNNKIENLRELSQSQNQRNSNKNYNRKRKPSSKHKGVSKNRSNKWQARIKDLYLKKDISLGTFEKEDDAGQAYNDAIRKYGLEEVSVMNDTPQERARTSSLFNEPEVILNLK